MDTIISQINQAGVLFCQFAWPMLLQSSILIVLLLALDVFLRRRIRAVMRYGLWMLVPLKLLLPASLSLPTGLGYWIKQPPMELASFAETTANPKEILSYEAKQKLPPAGAEAFSTASDFSALPPKMDEPSAASSMQEAFSLRSLWARLALTLPGALFLTWVCGVIGLLALIMVRLRMVRRLTAKGVCKRPNASLQAVLESSVTEMGVRSPVGLKMIQVTSSPAVYGLARPVILLPQAFVSKLNDNQLRAVMLHELAHIKRGDLWINCAQVVLQVAYFYNPLLWLANAAIRRTREEAVDEMVLVAMNDDAEVYPETLLSIARLAMPRQRLALGMVGIMEKKSALGRRIRHMLSRPFPTSARIGLSGAAALLMGAFILLPMAQAQKKDSTEPAIESAKQSAAPATDRKATPSYEGKTVEEWFEQYDFTKNTSDKNQVLAMKAFVGMGQAAAPFLARMLSQPYSGVSSEQPPNSPHPKAAWILSHMGTNAEPALAQLVSVLSEQDDVAGYAAKALGNLGERAKSAVPALRKSLQSGNGNAAVALVQIAPEDPELLPALIDALQHGDPKGMGQPRLNAARALGRLGKGAESAIPALLEAANDFTDSQTSHFAMEALGKIASALGRPRAEALIKKFIEQQRSANASEESVSETIAKIKSLEGSKKVMALQNLGGVIHRARRNGNLPSAETLQQEIIPFLKDALHDPNERIQRAVTSAISAFGRDAEPLVPDLLGLIQKDGAASQNALNALHDIAPGDKRLLPVVIPLLDHWSDDRRQSAATFLTTFGPEASEAVPGLTRLTNAPELRVRRAAHLALWRIAHKPLPLEVLNLYDEASYDAVDSTAFVASRVIPMFGEMGPSGKYAVPALKKLAHHWNPNLRKAAMAALEKISPEDAKQAALDDEGVFNPLKNYPVDPSLMRRSGLRAPESPSHEPAKQNGASTNADATRSPTLPSIPDLVVRVKTTEGKQHTRALQQLGAALAQAKYQGPSVPAQTMRDDILPIFKEALYSTDPQSQIQAANHVHVLGPDAESLVPRLLELFKQDDTPFTAAFLQPLTELHPGDKSLLPMILPFLKNRIKPGRETATAYLRTFGPEAQEAVADLTALLADSSSYTRVNVQLALWRIARRPISAEIFTDYPKHDFFLQQTILPICGEMGSAGKHLVPNLKALAHDSNENVRKAALDALVKISPEDATPVLQDNGEIPNPFKNYRMDPGLTRRYGVQPMPKYQGKTAKEWLDQYDLHGNLFAKDQVTTVKAFTEMGSAGARYLGERYFYAYPPHPDGALDRDTGRKAILILSRMGANAEPAMPELILAVTNEFSIAGSAAKALGNVGPKAKQALPQLLESLQSGNGAAAEALVRIAPNDSRVLPALIEALQTGDSDSPGQSRLSAARALGYLGKRAEPAIPALLEVLAYKDEPAAQLAVTALRKIAPGHPDLMSRLDAFSKENQNPQKILSIDEAIAAVKSPGKISKSLALHNLEISIASARHNGTPVPAETMRREIFPLLQEALDDGGAWVPQAAASVLGSLGKEAEPLASKLLEILKQGDSPEMVNVLGALGNILPGDPRLLPIVIPLLDHWNPPIRQNAAGALKTFGPEAKEAVPGLIAISKEPDLNARCNAHLALWRIDHKPLPLEVLDLDDSSVFFMAHTVLPMFGDMGSSGKYATPKLRELTHHWDARVQKAAMAALEKIGPEDAKQAARENANARTNITASLAELPKPSARQIPPALGPSIRKLRSPLQDNRLDGLSELGRMETEAHDAIPFVMPLLKDTDAETRAFAASVLGDIGSGDPTVVQPLTEVLRDATSDVRVNALVALRKLGPKASDAISPIELCLNDEDDAVRAAATEALKKIQPKKSPARADE